MKRRFGSDCCGARIKYTKGIAYCLKCSEYCNITRIVKLSTRIGSKKELTSKLKNAIIKQKK